MKKYRVQYATRSEAQIAGREPYDPKLTFAYPGGPVEAESPEAAIEFAIDIMMELTFCTSGMINEVLEHTDDSFMFRDLETGERTEYYNFTAAEAE